MLPPDDRLVRTYSGTTWHIVRATPPYVALCGLHNVRRRRPEDSTPANICRRCERSYDKEGSE